MSTMEETLINVTTTVNNVKEVIPLLRGEPLLVIWCLSSNEYHYNVVRYPDQFLSCTH